MEDSLFWLEHEKLVTFTSGPWRWFTYNKWDLTAALENISLISFFRTPTLQDYWRLKATLKLKILMQICKKICSTVWPDVAICCHFGDFSVDKITKNLASFLVVSKFWQKSYFSWTILSPVIIIEFWYRYFCIKKAMIFFLWGLKITLLLWKKLATFFANTWSHCCSFFSSVMVLFLHHFKPPIALNPLSPTHNAANQIYD